MRSLPVSEHEAPEGNLGHSSQPLASLAGAPYQTVPSYAVLAGTKWAQGFLAGWQEGASLFSSYTKDRQGCRTLGPTWLQPLVVELTELALFARNAEPYGRGWDEGLISAYDSAFGVAR